MSAKVTIGTALTGGKPDGKGRPKHVAVEGAALTTDGRVQALCGTFIQQEYSTDRPRSEVTCLRCIKGLG